MAMPVDGRGASPCPPPWLRYCFAHICRLLAVLFDFSVSAAYASAGRRLLLTAIRSYAYTAAGLTVAVAVIDPRHSRAKTDGARPVAETERRQMVVNRRFSERDAGRWT